MFDDLSTEHQLRFDLALIHRYMAEHYWNEGIVNHLTAMLTIVTNTFWLFHMDYIGLKLKV